jgi:chemotaxis protein CheD
MVCVCAERCVITTILATCVAVCLWDPRSGIGGANHYLLPHDTGLVSAEGTARFGTAAFEQLVEKLAEAGASRRRLRAKVFGGMRGRGALSGDLGLRNADLAFRLLKEQRIPVDAHDTGGDRSRKLYFHTGDGLALVSYF